MKQKEVFNKIGGIIGELMEQYEYLKTVSDDLNDLELELFAANAHFLTDHIEVLCKLNLQNRPKRLPPEQKEAIVHEKKFFEPVVQHVPPAEEEKNDREYTKPKEEKPVLEEKPVAKATEEHAPEKPTADRDIFSFIPEPTDTIRHELIIDEATLMDDDTPAELPAVIPPRVEAIIEIPEISSEAVKEEANNDRAKTEHIETAPPEKELTINEKISGQLGDKAAKQGEQTNIKPISDLKLAITLNDKLLYVKDLFNGYNLAYSEAIEILNRFNTFEEASRFLKTNYVTKNNWDSKPATVEKFYTLLKRRYA